MTRFLVHGYGLRLASGRRLISDLRLRIDLGEAIGLVGPNGCGKSLLAASWMGVRGLPVEGTGWVEYGGVLLHDSQGPCAEGSRQAVGRTLGFILSEPAWSLNPALTAGEQLELACRVQPEGLSPRDRLAAVGLPREALSRYPAYLSSGQRQRLAVACSLLERGLLICDDPATSLDPLLRDRLFEHWLLGKRAGTRSLLFLAAREEDLPPWVDRVLRLPDSRPKSAKASPSLLPPAQETLLRARGLKARRDSRPVLRGIDLELHRGELTVVLGESGAGKSTLLESLARTIALEPGSSLEAFGVDLLQLKPRVEEAESRAMLSMRERLRIAFQDPETVFSPDQRVGEVLARFPAFEGLELSDFLRSCLAPYSGERIGELGSWSKRALSLAAALHPRMEILLADEPFAGADGKNLERLWSGMAELASRGVAVMVVTHSRPGLAHRVLVFQEGQIVERLEGDAWESKSRHPYTRQWIEAAGRTSRPALPSRTPADPESLPVLGISLPARGEAPSLLGACDAAGRVYLWENEAWRPLEGERAEELAWILVFRGLDSGLCLTE